MTNMMFAGINFAPVAPELFLLGAVLALMLFDLTLPEDKKSLNYWLSLVILVITGALVWMGHPSEPQYAFGNMVVVDPVASVMKLTGVVTVFAVMVFGQQYLGERGVLKAEYYELMLFALMGLFVLISANNFLVMYVGLELLSLSSYSLVALERDNARSTEAAMKYFVLGALASGMLLYGISMVYGGTASLDVKTVAQMMAAGTANAMLIKVGVVFLVAGLAFKLGAAPFHMWVPDVYHGAPTGITLFISSAPKLAAAVFVLRVLTQALPGVASDWHSMLMVLAVLSIAIGNVVAVAQSNLKRMLAYSAISHMGFVVLGVMAGNLNGYTGSLFYVATYMLMTLGGFGLILLLARSGFEAEQLADLKGLAQKSPLFAGVLLVVMFSMAGIPSTVGFIAKFSVLSAVLESGQTVTAVIAVLLSVIGAFYYLRIVKLAYFDAPESDYGVAEASPALKALMVLTGLAILVLGIYPQPLLDLFQQSVLLSLH